MPTFERDDTALYYEEHDSEEHGNGCPVLLLAPGGMRSTVDAWSRAPWNPIDRLSDRYRVIAMDQRNAAGRSRAPIAAGDGWGTFTDDQLALMDHLGHERFHAVGMCIGGPYCMGLIQRAPDRIASAVLMQPIGRSTDNGDAFRQMYDGWAKELRDKRPDVDAAAWDAFRERLFGGDFLFNVDRDFVRQCRTPLLILMGNDLYHPEAISREVAELAPDAELIEDWKQGAGVEAGIERVRAFLDAHSG